jgi:DNA-binding NtrC family response regulator
MLQASHETSLLSQIPKAQGGTLLVGEIGEWPLSEQRGLLEFIDTRTVPHPESPGLRMLVNARIMATTSQALERRAQSGMFSADLLERFSAFRIEMPQLRDRSDEFEDIASTILGEITRDLHKEHLKSFDAYALERLRGYEWPGNLRELRNVLKLAVIAAQGDEITSRDLPDFGPDRVDFRSTREEFEKIYLQELMKTYDSDIERAAKASRIDRGALLTKLRRHGLDCGLRPVDGPAPTA